MKMAAYYTILTEEERESIKNIVTGEIDPEQAIPLLLNHDKEIEFDDYVKLKRLDLEMKREKLLLDFRFIFGIHYDFDMALFD